MQKSYLKPGLNVIIDGGWGSTGKGKLTALLGVNKPAVCASSFGPNAGHTVVLDNEESHTFMFKCLPTSCITAFDSVSCILPDSVIQVERFMLEVQQMKDWYAKFGKEFKVFVHPLVAIATEADKKTEESTTRRIASTMQGTGSAIAKKIMRSPEATLARDVLPAELVTDTSKIIRKACEQGKSVVVEVSQGYLLSINHGWSENTPFYPYTTSRDVTVGCALNACGCPPSYLGQVIGSIRVHPIRVGNTEDLNGVKGGSSGSCFDDHEETTWLEIAKAAGHPQPETLIEKTTVTKRVRRVFTPSMNALKSFVDTNAPDFFFLNFVEYLPNSWKTLGVTKVEQLTKEVMDFVEKIQTETGVPVKLIGTGAKQDEIVYINDGKEAYKFMDAGVPQGVPAE